MKKLDILRRNGTSVISINELQEYSPKIHDILVNDPKSFGDVHIGMFEDVLIVFRKYDTGHNSDFRVYAEVNDMVFKYEYFCYFSIDYFIEHLEDILYDDVYEICYENILQFLMDNDFLKL